MARLLGAVQVCIMHAGSNKQIALIGQRLITVKKVRTVQDDFREPLQVTLQRGEGRSDCLVRPFLMLREAENF